MALNLARWITLKSHLARWILLRGFCLTSKREKRKKRRRREFLSLAISTERREIQMLHQKIQSQSKRLISRCCALFQYPQSILRREFPMLPQLRWLCPNLDCSSCAQSCQYRFGEALPFATGLADSFFLLLGAFVKPEQRHPKIPNDGDAFLNAAMERLAIRIRIYSCCCQNDR